MPEEKVRGGGNMTKNEAQIILAGLYEVSIDDEGRRAERINKALDMAIESLERVKREDKNYALDLIEHGQAEEAKKILEEL